MYILIGGTYLLSFLLCYIYLVKKYGNIGEVGFVNLFVIFCPLANTIATIGWWVIEHNFHYYKEPKKRFDKSLWK